MIKTFRGILADGTEDRIRLSTIKGKVGYRIVKFQIISSVPLTASGEQMAKIFLTSQSSITNTVDFSESDLLGVALFIHNDNYSNTQTHIIFDTEVFNQDIYISYASDAGSNPCNYYIELEVISLTDMGAEYTTLKDIRSEKQ
ncbi:MAG TPA: hypothetical protein EYN67_02645 [Flavobacteriales bacterium]|nr:hypothetical protein [Flavobacteriales bacterium]